MTNLRVGLLVMLVLAGCQKVKEDATPIKDSAAPADTAASEAKPVLDAPNLAPPTPKGNPEDVLVDVDGTKLTRGEVDQQLDKQFEQFKAMQGDIPPEALEGYRDQGRRQMAQQFAIKSVLMNEAARTGVKPTDKDMEDAYAKLGKSLPEGVTMEEALKKSPMGEEKMRQEIRDSVTINMMLESRLSNQVAVAAQDVDQYVAEHQDELKTPETVHARHILIKQDENADEAAKAAGKTKAEDLRKQLLSGTNFADLARQFSDCPSKERGGDLGTFGRGQMVPAFEDAAFSQKTNEVGEVLETKFGYHIVQVLEHNPEGSVSRDQVQDMLKNQKMQTAARTFIKDLQAAAKIKYDPSVAPAEEPAPVAE